MFFCLTWGVTWVRGAQPDMDRIFGGAGGGISTPPPQVDIAQHCDLLGHYY